MSTLKNSRPPKQPHSHTNQGLSCAERRLSALKNSRRAALKNSRRPRGRLPANPHGCLLCAVLPRAPLYFCLSCISYPGSGRRSAVDRCADETLLRLLGLRPAGSYAPAALRPGPSALPPGIPRGCAPRATRSPCNRGPRKRGQSRNPRTFHRRASSRSKRLRAPRVRVTLTWPQAATPCGGAKTRTNRARPGDKPPTARSAGRVCAPRQERVSARQGPKQPARSEGASPKGRFDLAGSADGPDRPVRPRSAIGWGAGLRRLEKTAPIAF